MLAVAETVGPQRRDSGPPPLVEGVVSMNGLQSDFLSNDHHVAQESPHGQGEDPTSPSALSPPPSSQPSEPLSSWEEDDSSLLCSSSLKWKSHPETTPPSPAESLKSDDEDNDVVSSAPKPSRRSAPSSSEVSSVVAAALNLVGSHAIFGRNWWGVIRGVGGPLSEEWGEERLPAHACMKPLCALHIFVS